MPHNRFYIDTPLNPNTTFSIEDDQCHYFRKVLRGAPGDTIEVINGKGALAHATVSSIGKNHFDACVTTCENAPSPPFVLTLAIGFLKPSHLEYALEKACELGSSRFLLFEATLSEKKAVSPTYFQRLSSIVEAATKQCGRLYLPEIIVKNKMLECLDAKSAGFFGDFGPEAAPVHMLDLSNKKDVTVFIGPESGFTDEERRALISHQCRPISLHPNTLRAETAVVAATLLFQNALTSH